MDLSKCYEYFQPEKDDARVHIVGCGSVGSTVASLLARYGVTQMTLWDFDVVEPKNLANQMFRQKDVGQPKVDALADILTEINPDIVDGLKLQPEGWDGQQLSGYVFLCVDNIERQGHVRLPHPPGGRPAFCRRLVGLQNETGFFELHGFHPRGGQGGDTRVRLQRDLVRVLHHLGHLRPWRQQFRKLLEREGPSEADPGGRVSLYYRRFLKRGCAYAA